MSIRTFQESGSLGGTGTLGEPMKEEDLVDEDLLRTLLMQQSS